MIKHRTISVQQIYAKVDFIEKTRHLSEIRMAFALVRFRLFFNRGCRHAFGLRHGHEGHAKPADGQRQWIGKIEKDPGEYGDEQGQQHRPRRAGTAP